MFKLCQKPFAERKPIIQHPRPGRCLLQIQVPLILTQLRANRLPAYPDLVLSNQSL
uniref:Uncharacterized protein n=1 Tax=Brassica oleracea TaxID=3712 RepID=A0A3P6G2Y7_BRAOL|nr:unnamed protein product [Brassica oleracea]